MGRSRYIALQKYSLLYLFCILLCYNLELKLGLYVMDLHKIAHNIEVG